MGTCYFGNQVHAISEDELRKLCPSELDALLGALEKYGPSFGDFCRAFMWDPADEINELGTGTAGEEIDEEAAVAEIAAAWERLRAAFARATTIEGGAHLELEVTHICKDEVCHRSAKVPAGDGLFVVTGVMGPTPAGQAFVDRLEEYDWVSAA